MAINFSSLKQYKIYALIFSLIILFYSSGCGKLYLKDDLPATSEKGYVQFNTYSGLLNGKIYRIQGDKKVLEGSVRAGRDFRLAKIPGDYVFVVEYPSTVGTYRKKIEAQIVKDMILNVTLDVFNVRISESMQATTTSYNFKKPTVGENYIPVNIEPKSIEFVISALKDEDVSTRCAAIEILGKNIFLVDEKIIACLNEIVEYDPKYYVKKRAKDVLKALGQKVTKYSRPLYDNFIAEKTLCMIQENDIKHYNMFIDEDKYIIENKDVNNVWCSIKPQIKWPKDYNIILGTKWESGVNNYGFGLIFGTNKKDFHSFLISANGYAVSELVVNNAPSSHFDWVKNYSIKEDRSINYLKIEVRGNDIAYYVNNSYIGNIKNNLNLEDPIVGVIVSNIQKVGFRYLKITKP